MIIAEKPRWQLTPVEREIIDLAAEIIRGTPHALDRLVVKENGIRALATGTFENLLKLNTEHDSDNVRALKLLATLKEQSRLQHEKAASYPPVLFLGRDLERLPGAMELLKTTLENFPEVSVDTRPNKAWAAEVFYGKVFDTLFSIKKDPTNALCVLECYFLEGESLFNALRSTLVDKFNTNFELYFENAHGSMLRRNVGNAFSSYHDAKANYEQQLGSGKKKWNDLPVPLQYWEHDMGLPPAIEFKVPCLDLHSVIDLLREFTIRIRKIPSS